MASEGQWQADLSNGFYLNPIMAGDFPDPSVVRVGTDYYMTHSSGYGPALLVWRSRDLVNWQPLTYAVPDCAGPIAAPEFIYHDKRFYIYYPANRTNWVVTADSPKGPWSKPVDLGVGHIDPGHVVGPDGRRFLHLSKGLMAELSTDGMAITKPPYKVFDAWPIPEDWIYESIALESPKFTIRNGWYYLTVAQGGTAGPATSHAVISARGRTPWGPWEYSPYNPIIHTTSREEMWWSKGHGTLVDTPNGEWWIIYHAYRKEYHTLGRQNLLEPIEWTDDGWFRVPEGIRPDRPIRKPFGEALPHGMALSDTFAGGRLGMQWHFYGGYDASRFRFGNGWLTVLASGEHPGDSRPMTVNAGDLSYEVEVEVAAPEHTQAGITLFYNPQGFTALGAYRGHVVLHRRNNKHPALIAPLDATSGVRLRVTCINHEARFFYNSGAGWKAVPHVAEVSGFHHNVFGQFLSLRPGLYVAGEGKAKFRGFTYRALSAHSSS